MEKKKELQKMEKMYQEFIEEFMTVDNKADDEDEEEEDEDDHY